MAATQMQSEPSSSIQAEIDEIFENMISVDDSISGRGFNRLLAFILAYKELTTAAVSANGIMTSSISSSSEDRLELLETKITSFMNSKPNKQRVSLTALDALMANQIKLTHYTRHLSCIVSIRPNDDLDLQQHAAATLGKLYHASGNKFSQTADYQIRVFFEFLNHYESETPMLQAVLMLKEIAIVMPSLFIAKADTDDLFSRILPAFRSKNATTREKSAALLKVVIRLYASREVRDKKSERSYTNTSSTNTWARQVYRNVKLLSENLTNETDCHGAILMLRELVSVATDRVENVENNLLDYNLGTFTRLRKLSTNTLPVAKFEAIQDTAGQLRKGMSKNVYSNLARRVINQHFNEICTQVLSIMLQSANYKDMSVKNVLMSLIPMLAAVDPNAFQEHIVDSSLGSSRGVRKIFHESITFLIESFQNPKATMADRQNLALIDFEIKSLALLTKIMGKRIETDKTRIMNFISTVFSQEAATVPSKRGGRQMNVAHLLVTHVPIPSYALVSYFIEALEYNLEEKEINVLIELVMKQNLNRHIALCFHDICANAPSEKNALKLKIRNRLFSEISSKIVQFEVVRVSEEVSAAGQPNVSNLKAAQKKLSTASSPNFVSQAETLADSTESVIMALEILAAFDFTGVALSDTIAFCAQRLLSYEKRVRLSAAKACCNLLLSDDASFLLDTNRAKTALFESDKTLRLTLPKLLNIGVTDCCREVRLAIISSLDSSFDQFLAQDHNLNSLFIGLYDEYFAVREYVVCILGRLSDANSACVMPALRKFLLQLLKEFKYTNSYTTREQCSILLGNLLYHTPKLLTTYMDSIMGGCLIPKLFEACESFRENNIAICIMRTIGILSEVSGHEISCYLDQLMPLIIDFIKDNQNTKKRIVGLWCLGNLIFSAGKVVDPCREKPELLEVLLELIKTEVSIPVRRETIKVLGVLGPLDPYVYKTILQPAMFQNFRLAEKEIENTEQSLTEATAMMESSVMEDIYPAMATDALLKILNDPTQSSNWPRVVDVFGKFVNISMGIKSVSLMWRVIPACLNVLRNPQPLITDRDKLSEMIFKNLSRIANTLKDHMRPYVKDIVECASAVWDNHLELALIDLLSCLALHVGSDLRLHFHLVLPNLVSILKRDSKTGAHNQKVKNLIASFRNYGVLLENFVHMLLPSVMMFLETTTDEETKRSICSTLIFMCEKIDMSDYSSLMIHSLLRVVEEDQKAAATAHSSSPASSSSSAAALQSPLAARSDHGPVTDKVFDVIAAICFTLKSRFHIFYPIVDQVCKRYSINHFTYQFVLDNVDNMFHEKTGKYKSEVRKRVFENTSSGKNAATPAGQSMDIATNEKSKGLLELPTLQRAWSTEGKVSKADWMNWFDSFSYILLSKSPSPILRCCIQLDVPQLRRDLFNVAFLSCWVELDQLNQDELIRNLKVVLQVENVPELTLAILNLAEFMEHSEKGPLPLDHILLGDVAMKNGAYAKALYYRESALLNHPPGSAEIPKILESLLHVNTKLQNYEAATGILKLAKRENSRVDESWYESLGQWENALKQYNYLVGKNLQPKHVVGKMRCLEGLAEWEELYELVKSVWGHTDFCRDDLPETISELGVKACWALGKWDDMNAFINEMPEMSLQQTYYQAAYALHKNDTYNAIQLIQDCRDLVDNDLTTLVKESYSRAYSTLVDLKHFSEMEEVIAFKFNRSKQESIKQMWRDRLLGGQPNVQDWLKSLVVHSLAIQPEENEVTLLKFASLCMRHNRMKISFKVIQSLLPDIKFPDSQKLLEITDPDYLDREIGHMTERLADACDNKIAVVYMYLKQLWEVHEKHDTIKQSLIKSLSYITKKISVMYPSGGLYVDSANVNPLRSRFDSTKNKQVARFCLLYASWQKSFFGINKHSISEMIKNCQLATDHCKQWYKAWRMLAESSAEALNLVRSSSNPAATNPCPNSAYLSQSSSSATLFNLPVHSHPMYQRSLSCSSNRSGMAAASDPIKINFFVAVDAFVKSIKCCWQKRTDTLQDTLRLLTLLFENEVIIESPDSILETLKQVHVDVWLQVIPQLIARVSSAKSVLGKIILPLLVDVGKTHPHAAVYSLMVGAKNTSTARAQAIQTVLDAMKDRYPDIVKQAQILSHELIRVSILWHELWHEGLEEASRMYFAERNARGMLAILDPLHLMIEKGAETMKEQSFIHNFGRDLAEAKECCNRFQHQGNARELSQAWDLYYQVFRNITKQNQSMTSLELSYVSPKLLNVCRDLDLAIPGTYEPNQPIIRIASVNPVVAVIGSKQKPRKLCISGCNGKDYQFLLKGHEDMRQDERVLQLFGLVNSLLANDKHNLKRNLGAIPQYAVIPLSTNSGLCGWVPHCDPLHTLIKDYREKTKIHLNWEHRLMQKMFTEYEHLTKMQKVEVFEYALNNTNGLDLAKIMWYRSANSEIWYERRLTYTRSLAVMSMVGYILGLGDRHPSNIMLERTTGNIIHIDFGDCFEVAVHREKFPEKIPFRLTRMLILAMEVNGIEGNYRIACESTMRLLRQNKDSLSAVLETFSNDPLFNWLNQENRNNGQHQNVLANHGQRNSNGGGGGYSRIGARPATGAGAFGDEDTFGTHCAIPLQQEGNKKALDVLKRVNDKLNGEDFGSHRKLDIEPQVKKLISQATSHENLCQSYIGWCPFW